MNDILMQLRQDHEEIANIPQRDFDEIASRVVKRVESEPPPHIAFIGNAGVGKSTTLNALFNAGQEVSHTQACTQMEAPIEVYIEDVSGKKGGLIVYDMPGLGESIEQSGKHRQTYERVLSKVDVALWVLDAQYRAIEDVQRLLAYEFRQLDQDLVDRMVFAVNKIDLVYPGETAWHPYANVPSEEQERYIKARLYDIQVKVKQAVPSWHGTVVGYSAKRKYNLPQLFLSMLNAVSEKRQWVFASRKSLADFLELVDKRLLPEEYQPQVTVSNSDRIDWQKLDNVPEHKLQELGITKQDLVDLIQSPDKRMSR